MTESENNIFARYEISKQDIDNMNNKVKLSDTNEDLNLYCYNSCTEEDEPLIKHCRGVVFDHENNLVMNTFPYTMEYEHTREDDIRNYIESVFNDCSFYDSHEGALLRMFNYNDVWYLSTHRKLNAFRSKWSSPNSFGVLFEQALDTEFEYNKELLKVVPQNDNLSNLERFQSILDKNKQYMFLVCNNKDNRIVCLPPSKPTLFHVGTFIDGELVMTENCYIPYPKKHTFSSLEEILDHVSKVDIRNLQGIICFAPNNNQLKINNKEYSTLFNVRGNEPSIKFRYLQVRNDRKTANALYNLYPDSNSTFDEIENIIYEICKNIYSAYVQRYIKKKFITVPKEEFAVMRECHKWHEEDRRLNRINLNKILEVFNTQTSTNVNKMIRRFRLESMKKTEEKTEIKERKRSNTVSTNPSPYLTSNLNSRETSPLVLSNTPSTVPVNLKL